MILFNFHNSIQDDTFAALVEVEDPAFYLSENYEEESEPKGKLAPCPDGKVVCLLCGKKLSCIRSARRHLSTTHVTNQRKHCEICKKIFKNSESRNTHYRLEHKVTASMIRNAIN